MSWRCRTDEWKRWLRRVAGRETLDLLLVISIDKLELGVGMTCDVALDLCIA